MSTPTSLGRYHFQAWARRGIGASVTSTAAILPDRASLDVQLALRVQDGRLQVREAPGSGIEIDADKLAHYSVARPLT